jgi:succinoglycan biosynthesis transport protein ExoP
MLEANRQTSIEDHAAPQPEDLGLGNFVMTAIQFVRRHYFVIISFGMLGLAGAILYLKTASPLYTASATVVIDRTKSQFIQQQSILADIPVDSVQVESQMQVMRSPHIALSVVDKLHLAQNPQFITASGGFLSNVTRPVLDLFSEFNSTRSPKSESEMTSRAVAALLRNLDVQRVGPTYLIDVSFRSPNPDLAAQIANAVAEAYLTDQLESKFEINSRATEWLQSRLEELRKQSAAAEQAVNSYKSKNKIIDAGGKPLSEQEVGELNLQLVAARAKTSEALARLNRIDATLQADRPDAAVDATVSDALSNPVITKLRQDYLDYLNKETEYAARYGKDHLAVVNLRNKVRDIRNSITSELRRLAETFKSDYLIAKQRQDDIQKQLAMSVSQSQELNSAQVTLRDLESAAQSSRSLYNLFQQRFVESTQQQSFPVPDARIMSPAAVPNQSSSTKPIGVVALGLFGGMILGSGLSYLRATMDRVFRTGDQVETILRVPCVALVPSVKKARTKDSARPETRDRTERNGPRTIVSDSGPLWTALDSPHSRFSEAIRSVKLAVDLSDVRSSNVVVGVTSSIPNEGKSTMAAALALLIAQIGRRAIVVDFDLRNPSLSRELAPDAEVGLIEVLSGARPIEDVIWTEPSTGMAFLPMVSRLPLIHTSEILASSAAKRLIAELRGAYEYVVVDLPPIAPLVDVRATTHLMDMYFLVVAWGGTKIPVVQQALKTAERIYNNLAGVIINKADIKYIARYDMSQAEYHYNGAYSRYGYND